MPYRCNTPSAYRHTLCKRAVHEPGDKCWQHTRRKPAQLTTDGGSEPMEAPKPKNPQPGVHYLRVPPMQMWSDERKREAVLRLFPEYSDQWNADQSALWNWIRAHAERYDIDHETARRMLADAGDPIWGTPNHEAISSFVWAIA